MVSDVLKYEYRPKWALIILSGAFFGLGTAVLGYKAANNDRGVIINNIIELGPEGATTFYWVLAAISAGFVATTVFLVYQRVAFHQRLVFGPAAMTVPASRWSREEKVIAYQDISALTETVVSGQRFLYVMHPGGRYTIAATLLPSNAAFAEICALLAAKVREEQSTEQSHSEPNAAADVGG
ncbi:MAG: hypothetical protein HS116_10135 [Planctomycetes bacterium]|nr:hypothetical protein [Planctomycetota bacterium]